MEKKQKRKEKNKKTRGKRKPYRTTASPIIRKKTQKRKTQSDQKQLKGKVGATSKARNKLQQGEPRRERND